jgi:protein-disulfide isomerase
MRFHAYLVPLLTALLAACEAAETSPAAGGATPREADERVTRADSARIKGARNAPVWIVEISDFQCPFCRQWQQETYPALEREYVQTGKARLAYVHLPLSNHRHALPAAEATMCAGAQSRFWELHDAIFTTQRQWTNLPSAAGVFDSLAATTGIDMPAWRQCVESGIMRPLIRSDYERAVASGASSTPTFLIMGDSTVAGGQPAMLVGAQPIENFRSAIDALLARRGGAGSTRD